ncbi:MAG: aldo/keto reductase [Firmicutes bacterium]|nr:aldo/keto reductase [Bacillota bacterium]
MRYTELGTTGIKASVISFGGIPIQRVSVEEAADILSACKESGINFIDTARLYTNSEEKIGEYFKGHGREGWYVASKSPARDRDGMLQDLARSIENMACDYIDLYQLHNVSTVQDMERVLGPGGALEALEEAKKQGLVRHIGLTGHKPEILDTGVSSGRFECLQVPFNAMEKQALPLLKKAKQKGMGTIAMKPLAGGALTLAAAALDYILNCSWVDVAIPGMQSVREVQENCSVVEGKVTDKERRQLEKLIAGLGTHFCRRCEYCQPCPNGLNIPSMFLFEGYYTRYNLKEWAMERYSALPVKASDCTQCGVCESRCPYELPIRKMLKDTAAIMGK